MMSFDVELAKAGVPIVTRKGNSARIICYNRKDDRFETPMLMVLILNEAGTYEMPAEYTPEGKLATALNPDFDLFLKDGK